MINSKKVRQYEKGLGKPGENRLGKLHRNRNLETWRHFFQDLEKIEVFPSETGILNGA